MDLAPYEQEEVKEFHFHVYYYHTSPESLKSATEMREKLLKLVDAGFFKVVVGQMHNEPYKPHITAQFQVWSPREHFSRLFSWFALHRGDHPVLIHPLTVKEIIDHNERAAWMGTPIPLVNHPWLLETMPAIPLENAELGLGYSARK